MSQVSEPGWAADESPPPSPNTSSRSSSSSQSSPSSTNPEYEESPSSTSGRSSQESSETTDTGAPAGLAALLAEGITGLGSLATILTRKRLGLSFKFKDAEALAIARPIARLVQRRYKVKSDLNDAADTTGTFAAVLRYVDRMVEETDEPEAGAHAARGTGFTFSDDRPARSPARDSTLLSDEPSRSAAPTPAPAPAASVFRPGGRDREVGSGPLKDAIQGMG